MSLYFSEKNEKEEELEVCEKEEKILIEELKAIVVSSSKDTYVDTKKIDIQILDIEVPQKEKFIRKLRQYYLHKPITLELIDELREEVLNFYRDRNYPLVAVNIPPGQDITDGVIHVVVILSKLGKVKAQGAENFSDKNIASKIRTKPGEIIQSSTMIEDLRWINDNPFRNVNLIYEEGQEFGETDVTLQVKDRLPLRVYGGYENNGYNVGGDSRWLAGINFGNFLGLDQQFNYQFTCAMNVDKWRGQNVSYIIPLPWRDILKIYGSRVKSKPGIKDDGYKNRGKSWELDGRYVIPFNIYAFRHQIAFGYEFKSMNNFSEFEAELLYDKYMDISQFFVEYTVVIDDKYGMTTVGGCLYASPGKMTQNNRKKNFRLERPGARSNYIYGNIYLYRTTRLPGDFSWFFNFLGQFSGEKLLPTEQLSLGGFSSIRGYSENEVIADEGIIINNELRAPPFSLLNNKKDQLQLLVFVDFGAANDIDQNILGRKSTVLASVGPGLRYNIGENVNIRFDYGWQLNKINRNVGGVKHSRAHFSAIVSY